MRSLVIGFWSEDNRFRPALWYTLASRYALTWFDQCVQRHGEVATYRHTPLRWLAQ